MAPEALSSKVYPASDVWAAGVMAFQLLSGRLPFDDHRNPNAPSLSLVRPLLSTLQMQDVRLVVGEEACVNSC